MLRGMSAESEITVRTVLERLAEDPVCALHGMPGVGKSRLLHAAARGLSEWSEVQVLTLEAGTERLPEFTGPVLVLDSESTVDLEGVRAWVGGAPDRRALVASWLPSSAESICVQPMALPDRGTPVRDSAAGAFWVRCAKKVASDYALDDEREDVVRLILEHIDGVPLAIEELCGLLSLLDEEAILDRLEKAPAKLWRAAGQGDRPLLSRLQRYWAHLPSDWRDALVQTRAFANFFDAAAAEEIVELEGSVLDVLRRTIDASLLATRGAVGMRLVRTRALLGCVAPPEGDVLARARERHAHHVCEEVLAGRTQRVLGELMRAATTFASPRLGASREDDIERATLLLSAIDIASLDRHEATAYLDLLSLVFPDEPPIALERKHVSALRRLARYDDARDVLESASARVEHAVDAPVALKAELLAELGALHLDAGELDDALERLDDALDTLGVGTLELDAPTHRATALVRRGEVLQELGRSEAAQADLEQSYLLFREEGNHAREIHALLRLARVRTSLGRFDAARQALEDGRALAEKAGVPLWLGYAQMGVALVAHTEGQLGSACEMYKRAERALQEHGSAADVGTCATYLALALHSMRQLDDASLHARRGRQLLEQTGSGRLGVIAQGACVGIEADLGALDVARARLAAALEAIEGRSDPIVRFLWLRGAHLPERALPEGDDPPSVELRLARQTLQQQRKEGDGIRVQLDGRAFVLPSGEVSLRRRQALRRSLAALAQSLAAAPGTAMSVDDLFDAGWPGERLGPEHANNRVYNAVSELRSMGLKQILIRQDDGYLLDPAENVTAV
mgnify:CR=1 FL=1